MTHIAEDRLALYVDGDLEAGELRSVEEHLGACRECRDLLAEFRGNSMSLEMRLGEPTTDELLAVRQGVIQHLQKRRTVMTGWRWTAATVAMAATFAGVLFLRQESPRKDRESASSPTTAYLQVPYQPVAEVSIPNLVGTRTHARRVPRTDAVGIRSVNLLAEQDGPRFLKMATADPNVVILWQLDERTRRP